MSEKLYLDTQDLLDDSWRLGAMVADSGFRPSFIVAIWRGGVPIGVAVQEMLKVRGIESDHIAIRTASYDGIDGRADEVKVFSMNYIIKHVSAEDSLPYYKPSRNLTERVPDYYLHETEQWLKFPHSLEGLSHEEISAHRPELARILAEI